MLGLVLLLTSSFVIVQVAPSQQHNQHKMDGWLPATIPNPIIKPTSCQLSAPNIFLCDPDNILTNDQQKTIGESLGHFFLESSNICNQEQNDEIQVAAAIIRKMDLRENSSSSSSENEEVDSSQILLEAAKKVAISTHNDWGVGTISSCGGGTGILIFLSVDDRTCFISKGEALSSILTDYRLDHIISQVMTPKLRQNRYDTAIVEAVKYLKTYIAKGPPTFSERLHNVFNDTYPLVLFISLVFTFVHLAEYKRRRDQSEYAAVSSRLNDIERDRALALQGRYDCTSCPICLEKFQICTSSGPNLNSNVNFTSRSDEDTNAYKHLLGSTTTGSDGLPVKLLRCGHVYDETCWNEWVVNGKGNPMLCPICRSDVGRSTELQQDIDSSERTETSIRTEESSFSRIHHQNEMRFRLNRPMSRYPRYISQSNIVLWTQDGYDGPIARDLDFTRRNPAVQNSCDSSSLHRKTSSRISFGGGTSSSGRGGRW